MVDPSQVLPTGFTTRTGCQVEPRNVYRSFSPIADSAGIRVVRLHDPRHGTGTLLTTAGVIRIPAG